MKSFKRIAFVSVLAITFAVGILAISNSAKAEAPTAPSAPTDFTATAGKCGSGAVTLTWTDNSSGSAHFDIIRIGGYLNSLKGNVNDRQVKAGNTSYTFTGIKGDVWHKFYIVACADRFCSDPVGSSAVNPASGCSSASYSVTVAAKGKGSGTITGKNGDSEIINCSGPGNDCFESNIAYDKTAKIILTATPSSGSVFSKWEGDSECNNSTAATCSLSRTKNHNGLKANFNKTGGTSGNANTVMLNISKNGSGSGSLELDVENISSEAKTCDLSATCSFSFTKNKKVFLTVKPNSDSKVVSFSGGVTNSGTKCLTTGLNAKKDCYITMTGNKSVTVNLALKDVSSSSSSSSSSIASAKYTYARGAATDITSTSATLNGTINPEGEDVEYYFTYYEKGDSSANFTSTSKKTLTSGSGQTSVSAAVSGLSSGATYNSSMIIKGKTTGVQTSVGLNAFTTN